MNPKTTQPDTSAATLLVITTGFLIMYLAFSWRGALYVSCAAGIIGVIAPPARRLIERGWLGLSRVLSMIIPPLLLGAVFYLVVFPVSLLSRLFSKDLLMVKKHYDSYFIPVTKEFDKASFEKIW